MRIICSLMLALSLSIVVSAQIPKGFTRKYSTTLAGGGTAFNYEPAMDVWAFVEDQPGITGQQVFWGVKTFFHHYGVIRFVKHIKLTCGNVITRKATLHNLKDGQTIGGGTFSGDIDLADAVFKEDCANKNRIESVWISDVTCELADDDYMVVEEKNRLALIKKEEQASKDAERKRAAEERAAKEKAAAKEKEAKEKAAADAKAKAKGSSSSGYTYTPVPLTPTQQRIAWLNQYNTNMIKEQQEANAQYQKAQNIAEQSFANGVSSKQGLQNYQANMSDLAESQNMSTSEGRTRATVYAAQSVAAGVASLLIKERDYAEEARQREQEREYEKESYANKSVINEELQRFIDGDLVWFFTNTDLPEDKLFQLNVLNTRYLRRQEVDAASIYKTVTTGYGAESDITFTTGMRDKLWEVNDPLQPELASAFEGIVAKGTMYPKEKWERISRKHSLNGKYSDFSEYALKAMDALFLNNGKDSALAIGLLEKAYLTKTANNRNVYAKDALGEIYYDKAVKNNDPALMRKAFTLFTESLKEVSPEQSKEGLYQRIYHNQLLAAYRLVMDERTDNPQQYVNICVDEFKAHYKNQLANATTNLSKQADKFFNEKNYDAVLKLHQVIIDTAYHAYEFAWQPSWFRVGQCYANGWGVQQDTAEAIKCFTKAIGSNSWVAPKDEILKIRDPAAYKEIHALNHLFYRGIPSNVAKQLNDIEDVERIQTIQLLSSDAGYLIRGEKGKVYAHNMPDTLLRAIDKIAAADVKIKQIFIAPDRSAWSVIYDKNFYISLGLPKGLLNVMYDFYKNGKDISSIAIGQEGSWVIIEGNNGFTYNNISDTLLQSLRKVNSQGGTINLLAFHPQKGWLLIYNGNEYMQEDISQEVLKKLDEYKQKNKAINSVSFSDKGFIIN